jgi:hypothetical protein
MYQNVKILLATKHKKEIAIAPAFHEAFNAELVVPNDFDTDQYGSFSGETKRIGSAQQTLIKKATDAMNLYNYQHVIASEGSFGPHPSNYLIPADYEFMVFIDKANSLSIIENEISPSTNFSYLDIQKDTDFSEFLKKIKFGSHGLIIKNIKNDHLISKGITQLDHLTNILKVAFQAHHTVRLETDMRAMLNPTRMEVIKSLADKLVARIKNHCKKCNSPGFGKVSVQGKLRCEACRAETPLYQYQILNCSKCDHSEYKARDDGLTAAEAKYCDYCNP